MNQSSSIKDEKSKISCELKSTKHGRNANVLFAGCFLTGSAGFSYFSYKLFPKITTPHYCLIAGSLICATICGDCSHRAYKDNNLIKNLRRDLRSYENIQFKNNDNDEK